MAKRKITLIGSCNFVVVLNEFESVDEAVFKFELIPTAYLHESGVIRDIDFVEIRDETPDEENFGLDEPTEG